jgi:type IV pilus assembly protein PilV
MTILNLKIQRNDHRSRGFTLVEVLVSLVILSIGLLGIAKLMLFSSHSNDSAYLRSQATDLAYEMLDYMRSNIVQAGANGTPAFAYNTALTAPATDPGFTCNTAPAAAACVNIAAYDVYQWKLRLNANNGVVSAPGALPDGKGSVLAATDITGRTTVTIVVSWDDSVAQTTLNAGAPNTQSITLETVL